MASPMATVQARVPLKAGHVYVQGSSFEVKGAGEWYVNGVYTRTPQRVNRADVFQKAGSSLVLMRKGDEGWSLVDLRGSTTFKWSLRSVELYHCCRRPPGHTPPPVGWACAEGEGPAPMLMPGKSPLLPFLKPKTPEETEIPMGTSSFWVSSASRRAAQLAQDALEPIRASRPMRGPTGRPAVVANPAKGGGVPDGSRSQPLLQSLKTTGPRSTRAPPGTIVQFLRSFRVVLTRPYVQVPWGYEWNDEFFTQTGGRVIRDIQGQSPLERWNVWQEVTGRPDLCVQPGDRLMKADGRWAYCEQEVCLNDSGQAPFLESPELATQQERRLVLEFMRPVGRPAPLMRPRLEVWDTQSALVISWDHPAALEPYKQVWGWSVAICDMDHDIWFIVDGATFVARSLTLEGSDVAVAKPELCTIYVSDGLSHARPYAACIAMLTDQGWSAFSELSRSVSIAPSAKVSDAVLGLDPEDDDWKQRPRFACPRKMVPGASVPVTLRPGPRDLLSNERWLRMDVCVEGHDGLVLVPADSSMRLLQVEKIIPGSSADLWNQKQETFELHGYQTSFSVQPGDVINKINGFSGAQAMLYEVRRKPQKLIMTIDRHCGGNTTFEDIPEAKIFELDRLDIDASRDVEEFDWHVLMSQAEGALCAKMVEEDGRQLQKALDIFSEMLAEHTIVMVNQGIVQEADRRILLDDRVEAVLKQHVSEETAMDISLSVEPVRRRNSMEEEMPTTSDEISLIHLRKAMADAAMDEDQLELAIMSFVNSSKVVRQSFAGRELLEKAKGLQELWRWWRASADAQDELGVVLDYMLKKEADYQDDDGEFHDFDIQDPPYDLGPLKLQLEVCEKFKTEMGTLLHEGHVVWDRLRQSNLRFRAEKRIRAAMRDEREDDLSLDEALSAGEACGVNNTVISAGRELATNWRANHYKIALHDELFQAVKALRKHVEKRGKPGAGAPEQQRMRIAIAGSGLPPDNPLVLEAWGLLRQWEQDNVALRAEARLTSAVERVQGGFSSDAPEAGDLLGSAIAEVAQQGVDAQFLDAARKSLAAWQESRLKRARQELELAMRYSDEDYLKESLELSKTAGIDEETIEKATRQLARLRMVDEVHKMLDKAMEESELDPLEKAIQTAHSNFFVEEEMDMLWSGSLQARLRFWAKEIQGAVQVRQAEGLDKVVLGASRLVERSQMALELFRSKTGVNKVPDVAIRTLERDIRGLQLALPGGRDLANIHDATANIERVLGAVERYAAELPEVIAKAEAQVPKGLNPDLVQEAKYCQEEYAETVQELEDAISKATGEELKRALIAARLAGAPMELIDRGFAKLEKKFPELLTYTKTELELLVAKQEADDIQELSAEGRFLRLQDAADAAKLLVPRLEKSILEEVEDISMALAAERSFVMAVKEAKDIIAGLPMSPEDVHIRVLRLGHAIQACQMSAQEEAKKGLPEAYELQGLLEEEAERRQTALDSALALAAERGTPLKDLLISITAARQASVTPDLLEEPYARLRKKKLDFVTSALRNACSNGWYALAYALYHRGLALKAGEERNGGEWRSGAIEAEINRLRTDVTILKGEFLIETSGGAFGTSTWRKNPCYLIRCNAPVRAESKENRQTRKTFSSKSSNTGVRVSIALAEAGDFPATMALHVVKNNKDVHEAGAAHMLLPGFDVVAASHEDDDIPNCEFDLPPSSQPYFIVPSAAKGELGSFRIIINATEAVEVARIPANFREPRQSHQSFKLKWLQERPYNIFMGGGRSKQKAPMLSWYRNPQFRVSMQPQEAPLEQIPPSLRGRTPPPRLSRPETQELTLRPNTAPVTPTSLDRFQKVDKARLRSVFDSCDTQSNGLVNKRELIKAIRRDAKLAEFFGLPMEIRQEDGSRDEMEKLFQAMDSDSDREISWEEFVQFHTSVQKSKEDAVQELETPPPLLVVILTPHVRPKAGPAAIHIIRNTDNGEEDGLVTENPTFHEVLASSAHGREYSTASEVGAVLKLPEDGKDLVVVPSLKSTGHQGRFTISFMSTRELQVERIQ